MRKVILAQVVIFVLLWSTTAFCTTYNFGDSVYHWDGWTGQNNYGWNDDNIDVVGNPDISGGTATVQGGHLQSITFNYTASSWNMIAPGNLFINILNSGSDKTWDYVVKTMGNPRQSPSLASGDYGLYSIAVSAVKGVNDSSYILSGQDNKGIWAGYVIRDNHPIGIADALLTNTNLVGLVDFSGFPGNIGNVGSATYDFSNLLAGGLDLAGKDFILGWEMTCANDVVYEEIMVTPEPSTLFLLGAGLAGLGMLRRRKLRM